VSLFTSCFLISFPRPYRPFVRRQIPSSNLLSFLCARPDVILSLSFAGPFLSSRNPPFVKGVGFTSAASFLVRGGVRFFPLSRLGSFPRWPRGLRRAPVSSPETALFLTLRSSYEVCVFFVARCSGAPFHTSSLFSLLFTVGVKKPCSPSLPSLTFL